MNASKSPTLSITASNPKCLAIQLPSGTTVRSALNLGDNPTMLGAHVMLYGDIMKYCSGPGLKNTSNYKLLD